MVSYKNSQWQLSEDAPNPDPSSDLEWMLRSGQVSRSFMIENLGGKYYSSLYALAYAFLEDRRAARLVVEKALSNAVMSAHEFHDDAGVDTWVHRIAWKILLRDYRKEIAWRKIEKILNLEGEFSECDLPIPPTEVDEIIWQAADALPPKTRLLYILATLYAGETKDIPLITNYEEDYVGSEINRAQNSILNSLDSSDYLYQDKEALIVLSLQKRWSISQHAPQEIERSISRVTRQLEADAPRVGAFTSFREVLLVLVALVVVGVLVWVGMAP